MAEKRLQKCKKKKHVCSVENNGPEGSDMSEEDSLHVLISKGGSHSYWVSPLLEGKAVRMEINTGAAVYHI